MTEKINLSDHWKQSLDKGGKPIMLAHDTPRLETDWLIITPSVPSKYPESDKMSWMFKELDDWWSYQFKSDHDSKHTKFAVNTAIRVKLQLGNLKMDRDTGLPKHPQKRWQNISEIDREYKAPVTPTAEPVEPIQQNNSYSSSNTQDQGNYWDEKEKDIRGAQGFNLFVEIVTARQAHLLGLSDKVANEILVYNWYRLINNQKIRWDFLSSELVQDAISRGGVIESVTFPDEIVTEDMEQGW